MRAASTSRRTAPASIAEWRAAAVPFTAGLVGVFSTNASPFVLTLGTNFFFSAQVR